MTLNRALLMRWAPIPLRLIVGYGFLVHGVAKLERGVPAKARTAMPEVMRRSGRQALIFMMKLRLSRMSIRGRTRKSEQSPTERQPREQ